MYPPCACGDRVRESFSASCSEGGPEHSNTMSNYILIEEKTANHEIISVLIFGSGMVILILSRVAGIVVMMTGLLMLSVIYTYRLFSTPTGYRANGRFWMVRRINYSVLITVIILLSLLIANFPGRDFYAPAAGFLLIFPCLINIATHRKYYFRMNYLYCQIRIVVFLGLIILFYYLPA